ncbi:MAG: hypothetical protein LBH42_08480 [Treponema sp.]|jgi:hypothetical protein|nr:hypothetical protein [Treponema sp.]
MKGTGSVSDLMLERYHLGEVSAEERKLVEAELTVDAELSSRHESLDDSDRELRNLYPWEQTILHNRAVLKEDLATEKLNTYWTTSRKRLFGLCAAAVLLCVLFPSLYYIRGRTLGASGFSGAPEEGLDRLKGVELKHELSVYLKESAITEDGRKLPDQTLLKEGNTVQLAYTTPPGNAYYGVIFSIDGRSDVTMHYPYRKHQSPLLTTGKRTFLSEAYMLDDAPDFEIFFMVISQNPMNTENIINIAEDLAAELMLEPLSEVLSNPNIIPAKSAAVFGDCEVETITILK